MIKEWGDLSIKGYKLSEGLRAAMAIEGALIVGQLV